MVDLCKPSHISYNQYMEPLAIVIAIITDTIDYITGT